jgi:membrane protein DedA with SNARE-associated domain
MALGPRFKVVYYYAFLVLTLGAAITGFVFVLRNYQAIEQLQPHSYYGIFVVGFLASAPIPVFVPNAVIVFMLGSLLNPLLMGIMSGLGGAAGNTLSYYTGHAGTRFLSSFFSTFYPDDQSPGRLQRILERLKLSWWYRLAQRRKLLALFILSCLPTPLLTPMVMSLGAARVTVWKVILISWAGQTLQAIVLASLGYLGLRAILDVFGVFS